MSANLALKMSLQDAMSDAVGDPVRLGQLLAVLLSHTAIVRGLLDESAAPPSSSSSTTGGEYAAHVPQKR